jgi:hypothetical protein
MNEFKKTILLVEDDIRLSELVGEYTGGDFHHGIRSVMASL